MVCCPVFMVAVFFFKVCAAVAAAVCHVFLLGACPTLCLFICCSVTFSCGLG